MMLWTGPARRLLLFGQTLALALAGTARPTMAHIGDGIGGDAWSAWHVTPEIALATLVAAAFYAVGIWRRRDKLDRARLWRHAAFFGGLAAIFLALQSPIDALAERLFFVHQVQHFLLRMVGPMLLILALPQASLVVGMPDALRRRVLSPVVANPAVQGVAGALAHPLAATIIFIGVLYVWQIPALHNLALLNDAVHYAMHVSLLLAGLVFFWVLFDPRPSPLGARYGRRLMMLWIMMLSNILIGSYLTFKTPVLYGAYDQIGRLWGFAGSADERLGGMIVWIPSSMMGLVALVIVIHMWGRHETKVEDRRSAREAAGFASVRPATSGELVRRQAPNNRWLAVSVAGFVAAVFAFTIIVGLIGKFL